MRFNRYDNLYTFRADVLPILLEDEVCNNLPVSLIADESSKSTPDWLMGTVTNDFGRIVLIALCTKPFNLLLYAPKTNSGSQSGDTSDSDGGSQSRYTDESTDSSQSGNTDESRHITDGIRTLADELRRTRFAPPGVFAKTELSRAFAEAYIGTTENKYRKQLVIMKLDELLPSKKAPGLCRELTEDDLSFVPLWEQAFCLDCNIPAFSQAEIKERVQTRIGKNSHFIWEDGLPVSQAVFGRETPNGAVVTWVYTPPMYRGLGYASSVVGELSRSLLERGKKFCCLFADASNKTSCGIYRNLGYYDVCVFEEIHFT